MGFSTDCIHAGNAPDPTTGSVSVPIYQTSTYVQEALGKNKGWEYARTQNPTRSALETNLAVLEGGAGARAFASGMAAITAISTLVHQGDHVVCSNMTYGGTYRFFTKILANYGVTFSFVDTSSRGRRRARDPARDEDAPPRDADESDDAALRHREALGARAPKRRRRRRRQHVRLAVPAEAARARRRHRHALDDEVSRRTLGHGRRGGDREIEGARRVARLRPEQLRRHPLAHGLVARAAGIKTLVVRMERHESNGRAVAEHLAKHAKVKKVNYPGLPSHPHHELAKKQMSGFGAMISFDLGSFDAAAAFLGKVKLCSLGESLGGVETLISHPATMTHASIPEEERQRLGVTPGLVRISVGIEDIEDILADLDQALDAIP